MQETKELKPIQEDDIYSEEKIRLINNIKNDTGYPDGLNSNQIVRLIYYFGSRKMAAKSRKHQEGVFKKGYAQWEKDCLEDFFSWYGITYENKEQFEAGVKMLSIKFRNLLLFLKKRPAFVTKDIYDALKNAGYNNIIKNVVFVIDKNRNVVPRLAEDNRQGKETIPFGKMEATLWDIQNLALDKMLLIIQNITPKDIKKANLGMKSKALRDIYAMFHMSRLNQNNPNLSLVNLEIHTSAPEDKLKVYNTYISNNREVK